MEALKVESLHKLWPLLEPLFRKVVSILSSFKPCSGAWLFILWLIFVFPISSIIASIWWSSQNAPCTAMSCAFYPCSICIVWNFNVDNVVVNTNTKIPGWQHTTVVKLFSRNISKGWTVSKITYVVFDLHSFLLFNALDSYVPDCSELFHMEKCCFWCRWERRLNVHCKISPLKWGPGEWSPIEAIFVFTPPHVEAIL